jgi:hypothetical protein
MTQTTVSGLVFGSAERRDRALRQWFALDSLRGITGGRLPFGVTGELLANVIAGSMNGPVGDLLVGGWDRAVAVQRAIKATASDSKAERSVALEPHTVHVEKRSTVISNLGSDAIPLFQLVLSSDVSIDAAVVNIKGGRVHGVSPGRASASGIFGFARTGETEVHEIERWVSRPIQLPAFIWPT